MADTQGDNGIAKWQQVIGDMKQLEPATVVPAHYVTSDYKPAVLDFVEKYLADYRQAAAKSNNADELTAAMEKAWPQLPGKNNLVFSAKVFKGEQEWKIFTPYPPIGRAIKVDFGAFAFRNSFKDAHHMTFLGLNGVYKGLYQLTEQVEQGKNRVNIDGQQGWLLSLDVDDGPSEAPGATDNFWSEVYRLPVCVKSPEAADYATPATLTADARVALGTLEHTILNHDYEALSKICDVPVMIDYLLIQEFVYNVEVAAPRSIFLFKDKGDALWTFGPLWDFDAGYDFDWAHMTTGHTFFTNYRETVLGTDPAHHVSDYDYTSSFFTDMWKSREFVSAVKARWKQIRSRILAEFWPETRRYATAAADAMARNAGRWPIDKQYATEINRMEKWISSRTVYMDYIVDNYPTGH